MKNATRTIHTNPPITLSKNASYWTRHMTRASAQACIDEVRRGDVSPDQFKRQWSGGDGNKDTDGANLDAESAWGEFVREVLRAAALKP